MTDQLFEGRRILVCSLAWPEVRNRHYINNLRAFGGSSTAGVLLSHWPGRVPTAILTLEPNGLTLHPRVREYRPGTVRRFTMADYLDHGRQSTPLRFAASHGRGRWGNYRGTGFRFAAGSLRQPVSWAEEENPVA